VLRVRVLHYVFHDRFYDTLVVPIIENTAREYELKVRRWVATAVFPVAYSCLPDLDLPQDRMEQCMKDYPDACAVLVRRHGVYVWGDTWQKAKGMVECFDYLFELYVKMKQLGFNPEEPPLNGAVGGAEEPTSKRAK
jgi:methylthioribulose-1-phosphate dehydratase